MDKQAEKDAFQSAAESVKVRKSELIEMYLSTKYEFRFNEIKQKTEYRELGKKADFAPMDKYRLNCFKRELDSVNIQTSRDNLLQLLESDFSPAVDPITDYFFNLPAWDKKDHIADLVATVRSNDQERFYKYFRKWLIAVIANALEMDACKNHTCLVITGGQGKFKTTWIENLCPRILRPYLFTGKINTENKDTLTLLAEYLFINIDDQLSQINRKDENEIKNLITLNHVKYRRPYDPFIMEYPRRASFIGSVNNMEFLTDTTGSRRFLPFYVEEIYIDKALKVNMDKVYAQAYYLYKQKERYWFDDTDIADLYRYNEQFTMSSLEEELIQHYFKVPDMESKASHYLTSSMIKTIIEEATKQRLSMKKLGEAMGKLKYSRSQKNISGARQWVWAVIRKDGHEIEGQTKNHEQDF